jgi:hypothetical protein
LFVPIGTEPLKEIGSGEGNRQEQHRRRTPQTGKGKKRHRETEDDSVDISDEARIRATDKIKV